MDDVLKMYDNPNTSFIVIANINLEGRTIVLPEGSAISFHDGKLVNGTFIGNKTKLGVANNSSIGIELRGSWNAPIISDTWFDVAFLDDNAIMSSINHLQSDDIYNTIVLNREYTVMIDSVTFNAFVLKSNTTLLIHSSIRITPNCFGKYSIIDITSKSNVTIIGGQLIGDVGEHKYMSNSTSEWGMGLSIVASTNVTICNTEISLCTGDGIYLGGLKESDINRFDNACQNILISNVTCDRNRRQGMSIIHAKDVIISNCIFSNTGNIEFTRPGHGVDIEPNVSNDRNMSVSDVFFNKCIFYNNKGSDISTAHYVVKEGESNIKNIIISESEFDDDLTIRSGSFIIDNSILAKINIYLSVYNLGDVKVSNSTIVGGLYLHSSVKDNAHPNYVGILQHLQFFNCVFTNAIENKGSSVLCVSGDISRVMDFNFEGCVFYNKGTGNRKFTNHDLTGFYNLNNCTIVQ